MSIRNDPKTARAWYMFDWANSAYNLVITSTIFPAYYVAITSNAANNDKVTFFGREYVNTALSNYALSAAYLVMVILLPILSASADYRGNKKTYLKAFTWIGSLACMGLFFFDKNNLELGIICAGIAAMGYVGGVLFNNSYLPEIASPDRQDRVSARGYAYGYIGSVILQILCFVVVLKHDLFGISEGRAAQVSFVMVGLWWIGFAHIPFRKLPSSTSNFSKAGRNAVRSGFDELAKVWRQLKQIGILKRYLFAFFFYSMGVQTIMLVAAAFGEKELKLGASNLIATILIIQLVAIAGALLMSALAKKIGNIPVLIIVVLIWIACCIAAYYISNQYQFYALAAIVGLIMGGVQSLSRSTYSKFLPANTPDTASFFSFYDVTEKLAIVIGLFSFAYMEEVYDMRTSALILAVYFVIGLIILFTVLPLEKRSEHATEL